MKARALKASSFSVNKLVVFVVVFGLIGAYIIFRSFAASPPANIAYGDLDGDNQVTDTDKTILLSNYGTTSAAADVNGNGKVDVFDLSILLSHFGTSVPGGVTPSVNLMASPTFVSSGGSSSLTWTSTDVTSCTASGGWSGTKPASNTTGFSTGALNALTTYTLNCTGPDGPASTTMTVRVESTNVTNGWWHTSGTQILDSSNHVFRPDAAFVRELAPGSGADSAHPDACGDGYSVGNAINVTRFIQSGLNTVFINVSWANLEPTAPVKSGSTYTHTWNTDYLNTVNSLVQQYTAQHIHVVLNMMQSGWSPGIRNLADCEEVGLPTWLYPPHGDPNELHNDSIARCHFGMDDQVPGVDVNTIKPQEGYVTAISKFADFFKTNDYVSGLDAFSEPGWGPACTGDLAPPADALSTYYEKVGNALQPINSHLLMIFEDRIWNGLQKNGTEVPRKPVTSLANIAYGFEYYPDPPDHARFFPDFQAVVDRAHTDFGTPIIMVAFNAYEGGYLNAAQQGDPTWQADTTSFLTYLKNNNIGWAFWSLNPGAGSSLEDKTTDHNLRLDLLPVLQGGF
jgi:hypothetical protein